MDWRIYSQSGRSSLQGDEPPGADPHAGWCGRGLGAIRVPVPIFVMQFLSDAVRGGAASVSGV